jgi:2-(1,2-epoxy-1,2-dihydrophenyl)acetyl-CoA isomerase
MATQPSGGTGSDGVAEVGYDVDGAVATIVMRRPALTTPAKEQLLAAVTRAAGDDAIRAVVLTGTGRVFCAGQDLAEHAEALARDPATALDTVARHYNPTVAALAGAAKPVVAAVNGSCAGAGLSLALACDVRIAAAGARFATAFTAIGLTFDSGMSATLARAVGAARASELIMLGGAFTAEQALDWGLVGRVVDPADVPEAAAAVAAGLAAGPTRAFAAAKAALAQAWAAPLEEVLEAERSAQAALGATRDHRQAVRAFLDKAAPSFTGRD